MYDALKILPAGDQAFVVEFGDTIEPETNRLVHDLASSIEALDLPGVLETVPTYRSLLVSYDPLVTAPDELQQAIREIGSGGAGDEGGEATGPRVVHLPTLYGGEYGPDTEFVAQHAGMTPQEMIAVHSGPDYLVYMMGFSPGFPYLGGLDERLATPRLDSPRAEIAAGSVGIAEGQTGVYPVASPGGWRIIGRTPVRLFDPSLDRPTSISAGDYVRFVALEGAEEYQEIQQRVLDGSYQVKTETRA
jgi:KipI family sensor histidine kinase inhibitor